MPICVTMTAVFLRENLRKKATTATHISAMILAFTHLLPTIRIILPRLIVTCKKQHADKVLRIVFLLVFRKLIVNVLKTQTLTVILKKIQKV